MAFNLRKGLLAFGQDDEDNLGGMGGLLGGIFGKGNRPGQTPGIAGPLDPSLPQSAPMPGASQDKPASYWQGGDKFTWRDGAAGALAAVGDAFAMQNGVDGGAISGLSSGRTARMAADKAARDAAAKREADFSDWRRKEQWTRDNPADAYGTFQDNAGNQWRYNKRTGQTESAPMFVDPNDRQFVADGQMITVPNAVRSQQQGSMPTAPVGKLTMDPPAGSPGMASDQSDAETMRRLYMERFGREGPAMFQQWQRNNSRGR